MNLEDVEVKGDASFAYRLSADPKVLDLRLNFNPLMVTFCLFLRAISDQTTAYE